MKRELKGNFPVPSPLSVTRVARLIPMKRELKAAGSGAVSMSIVASRKAHPDEKGTESKPFFYDIDMRSQVARLIPMKRELKDVSPDIESLRHYAVARLIPMKRELKVNTTLGASGLSTLVARLIPMKRELKGSSPLSPLHESPKSQGSSR